MTTGEAEQGHLSNRRGEHQPTRPHWTCASCGSPWPCAPRRGELLILYSDSPVSLTLSLVNHFLDAIQDLPNVQAGALHGRFLGWCRRDWRPPPPAQEPPNTTNRYARRSPRRY